MKYRAQNTRLLTPDELLSILCKSAKLYSEYVDTTLLFIFREKKADACIDGTISPKDCTPRRDANTMYSKVAIMEQMLDLRNSKCYKIGEKDLVTRDNDFEMATGNSVGVMGYDSRIRIKGTNKLDKTKSPIPTTLLNNSITQYCSRPKKSCSFCRCQMEKIHIINCFMKLKKI